jgi:tellurite resistance protein TerC
MSALPWIAFIVLVVLLLAFDLGVLNRKPHAMKTGEALGWTAFWVSLGLCFCGVIYWLYENHVLGIGQTIGHPLTGKQAATQFLTAYIVEETLSIDNLFVMAMIFNHLAVPAQHQHRVLFFGILGALVFRGIFIGAGLAFINLFTWAMYLFGALLIYTAVKMFTAGEDEFDVSEHPLLRMVRRHYPVTNEYHGANFFVHIDGKRMATPMFIALVLVEASDIVFAVDSVPAVFGVTQDPFIAFTSNVFAILGLRSLYFALAAVIHRFRYVKVSLVFVLGFVGVKMMLTHHYHIDSGISLAVIATLLGGGVLASLFGKPVEVPAALTGEEPKVTVPGSHDTETQADDQSGDQDKRAHS